MPPKKKVEVEEEVFLGRFKSHLKMGIVGLPNVGKSTLFNTLSKKGVPAENFPFCTIDPNEARINIPDDRYNWLLQQYKPKSEVPACLEIWDIAGLIKGASEGAGLGNAFLSNIMSVDGIFHVCRAFEDADVTHVEDRVDPVEDLEIIHQELRNKDIERLEKYIEVNGKARGGAGVQKDLVEKVEIAKRVKAFCEEGQDIRFKKDWSVKEADFLNENQFLTAKPVVYLVNLSERDYQRKKNKWLMKIHEWIQAHGKEPLIPFSGALEATLVDMPADEQAVYCEENKTQSALPKIITTGFSAIRLIYFFTAGDTEVKCWTIPRGYKAPQAAGTIHTDFERGFICAEVMSFNDLKELGSEAAVKAQGKMRQEGKNYVVQDGDVILFKFNVTAKGK